ncbi:hypothetical protein GCM10023318_15400 [Nocardia callitridis]|uniref:Uncharacterized protein n=1 Tax=Nocardia callitridis TaxID=648753 RepID=A0ABP9K0Y6_9NOCA
MVSAETVNAGIRNVGAENTLAEFCIERVHSNANGVTVRDVRMCVSIRLRAGALRVPAVGGTVRRTR